VGRPVIYLDANVIIRLLEGIDAVRLPIDARVRAAATADPFIATSRLSRLECRCKPLKDADRALLALYDTFFLTAALPRVEVEVVERATGLRASYGFKTPDSIHLASAIEAGAAAFLTGHRQLARCTDVAVEIV
jgi:predicted nucleic acid-binding protein